METLWGICWVLRQILTVAQDEATGVSHQSVWASGVSPQAVWATGLSHQAGLFITVEKACIEGHLVSFSGKGIVIFPVVLLDIIKTKPNNSAGLWESRVSLERAGHKDPSSEWSCFHQFHSLLLFKVQRSPSKPERIPFLSLSNRSDPRT